MNAYQMTLSLTLQSPFLTHGTGAMKFGLDSFGQSHNGKLTLNGSLLKGNLRHKLEQWRDLLGEDSELSGELSTVLDVAFGSRTDKLVPTPDNPVPTPSHMPEPATLVFPWHLTEDRDDDPDNHSDGSHNHQDHKHYRIKIDQASGAVEEGQIQVIDIRYPPGTAVTFTGSGSFYETATLTKDVVEKWLLKALSDLRAIGAMKNIGFGQLANQDAQHPVSYQLEFTKQELAEQSDQHPSLTETPLQVSFTTDQPICFAQPRSKTSNLFVGCDYIPGSAIKATIAASRYYQNLAEDEPLKTYLDQLVIRHALPVVSTQEEQQSVSTPIRLKTRPLALMQFAIKGQDDIYVNAATCAQAHILKSIEPTDNPVIAGAYPTDYKDQPEKPVLSQFGAVSPELSRHLTVRTAIDKESGTADDGKLFAYESVGPTDTQKNQIHWTTVMSLPPSTALTPTITERFGQQLAAVLKHGLTRVGKTKATLTVSHIEPLQTNTVTSDVITPDELVVIKLESDAMLFTLAQYHDKQQTQVEPLAALYQDYFAQHFTDAHQQPLVTLHAFHTDQTMVGGEYLYHRFQKSHGQPYQPYILTTAGSTFTFRINHHAQREQVLERLRTWCHTGLPLLDSQLTWQTCPYLPQNGFGEISVMTVKQATYNQNSNALTDLGYRFVPADPAEL
ncbi:RAMP superfamily CRISPR-associated protein [Vibrio gazogenes]|uniref:CRISPR type III-associated protein domain-containing protein n=1 Tax=Vibrio gazogenes DSM 21264 = NBRC 103151 TaxID=1123492 RepID=A0A1M4UJK9_VIBGA|nr:RAMP superfamily CRISPR-associated protein [Vibrio gazogenes]USP15762.1 hypothetical protein MKS89_20470 [Vibrio gazogenes]SHE56845.1 hypothetical protein SAMN02745781_00474 [Vibrio gazogenes DSM 21264] [Vibrio gazogenes DSM 21264 = NBRC 103151]SJN52739.1 hypothetical protein BQ6471_00044 [Vibrio gazogenes]